MNQEIAAEWVKTLRSGKFSQARGSLEKEHSFCCLGVLCKVAPPSLINLYEDDEYDLKPDETQQLRGDELSDQEDVKEWAELKEDCGEFPDHLAVTHPDQLDHKGKPKVSTSLAELNDNGWTFLQIADFIEKNWAYL